MALDIAQSVINHAFAFDAVVFGGYVRDVIVRQTNEFRDLDILWLTGEHTFRSFLRILSGRHEVTDVCDYSKKYDGRVLKHFHVDGLPVDCTLYDYSFDAWKANDLCDMSCNLFYMSRKVHLGIRYIPGFLQFQPNPMHILIKLTKEMYYVVIEKNAPKHKVTKVLYRCLDMASRGWMNTGSDLGELGVFTPQHRGLIRKLWDVERNRVLDYLESKFSPTVYEKVTKTLHSHLESESSSEDDRRSVNKEDSDDDSLDET